MRGFLADCWWIAWRELKHFARLRPRILASVVQPLLWLTLMGNMLQRAASIPGFPAERYLDYMAPGVMVMSTLFGATTAGLGLALDLRLGYLQKLLAAPVDRLAIAAGKALAAGLQAALQGGLIFLVALALGARFAAGPAGVPLLLLLTFLPGVLFAALALSFAAWVRSHEGLMPVLNLIVLPLVFTSNVIMPASLMPAWLAALARVNPVSFAVGPLRALFLGGAEPGRAGAAAVEAVVVLAVLAAATTALAGHLLARHRD